MFPEKLLFQLVQRILGNIEQNQLPNRETGQLACKFRTDRATRTGYQHDLTVEPSLESRHVELYRFTSEQVLQLHLAYLGH